MLLLIFAGSTIGMLSHLFEIRKWHWFKPLMVLVLFCIVVSNLFITQKPPLQVNDVRMVYQLCASNDTLVITPTNLALGVCLLCDNKHVLAVLGGRIPLTKDDYVKLNRLLANHT